MKKSLICGVASLVLAATPVFGAFAEDPQIGMGSGGTPEADVTVGEVDRTTYSVDIVWGDMTFDWKYDDKTNQFNF